MDRQAAAVYAVHDDAAYLAESIASVRETVPVFAFVSRLPWHGEPGAWEAATEIARDAGAEVVLGDWDNEHDHRSAALALAAEQGFTHALIPDGDEILEPGLLRTLLKVAEAELADRVFVHWDTYWKSDRYVIRPREGFTPCIMLDVRVAKHEYVRHYVGGRPLLLSPEHGLIKHMSYAGSNERIWRKITTWSHREEVVPGWYENVWLRWDENKLMRNLHPTHPPAYGFAERVFTAEDAEVAEAEFNTEGTENTEKGKGSREDAKARSAEVGRGFLDRIDRITRRDCDHGAGLCRSGQRARRAVCSGLEVPVMAEPVSASGKPGKGRPGPRRAAPTTPDALHPTPDRNNENRCINELKPSGANHTYSYLDNGLRWSYQMGGSANVYSLIWDGDDLLNEYINGAGSPSTRYGVLDGEILSRRAGGTRYVLVPDPLGSVNHLIDTSLNKAATLAYWPYGETAVDTGAGSPLRFLGALGYYTATANRVYVRSQQFRPDLVRAQSMPDSRRGQEWWPGLDHWPLPPPIDHRLGNPAKCTEVVSCLNDPNMPRCSSSKNHPASIHLVLCVFWQETSMNGVRDWGIGSCTKEGFDDLVGRRKCEWLARFRDFRDFIRRATPCEKARAARDEIECNGLVAYGPNDGSKGDYAGDLGDRIRGCECCLQHRLPWWTLDDWCSTICFPVVHR